MLRLGFCEFEIANRIEGLFCHGAKPPFLRGALLALPRSLHHPRPRPKIKSGVGTFQVRARNVQIQHRLTHGLVEYFQVRKNCGAIPTSASNSFFIFNHLQ